MVIEQREQESFPPIERIPLASIEGAQLEGWRKNRGYCEDVWATGENWAAVADGMGGRRHAQDAAFRVMDFYDYDMKSIPPGSLKSIEDVRNATLASFDLIQSLIKQEYPGTGTTLATASAWRTSGGDKWTITWIGDSRVYCVQKDNVTRLTYDTGPVTKQYSEESIPSLLDEVDTIRSQDQFDKASGEAQHILMSRWNKYPPSFLGNYFGIDSDQKLYSVRSVVVDAHRGESLLLVTDGVTDNLDRDTIQKYADDPEALVRMARKVSMSREFRSVPDDMTACLVSV